MVYRLSSFPICSLSERSVNSEFLPNSYPLSFTSVGIWLIGHASAIFSVCLSVSTPMMLATSRHVADWSQKRARRVPMRSTYTQRIPNLRSSRRPTSRARQSFTKHLPNIGTPKFQSACSAIHSQPMPKKQEHKRLVRCTRRKRTK